MAPPSGRTRCEACALIETKLISVEDSKTKRPLTSCIGKTETGAHGGGKEDKGEEVKFAGDKGLVFPEWVQLS